ncbi:DUF1659 domain-containing protein [Garciella nitratireducens]|uniref:DUF1659 domain-containing protein n=1 Tax=Garciella nitratireducens DSM 15102 TaxID=1121911 RepID=A0A1T4LUP4_9FIRM|nr:DUF1659 domain-containing protein [Garciella nitratireducens]RBP44179.1 uncharacterized protein DUF1659 [Garciella nitratireducens]SJZ58367.1 Protein of unknown function [Garciella nitratireducens DSM 15102]
MAVEANIISTKMQLKLNTGLDEKGKEIIKTKTYSNVKPDAKDQVIYDIASSLAVLQQHDLEEIHRVNDTILISME